MYTVSSAFLDELRRPVQQFVVKMDVLDTDFEPITGGTFFDVGYGSDTTAILVDGEVDVDVSRLARRTFTASLLNKFGEWSPNAEWSGTFYVDRLIRLWRGVRFSDNSTELVPIGTFFIDHADVVVERNMSIVALSGTDLWKKLAKSQFTAPQTWAISTPINDVITDIVSGFGLTAINLDPLTSRTTSEKELNKKLLVEIGDSGSEVIGDLIKSYGIDLYFDPMGTLTSNDLLNPADREVVFRYVA
jgi:hypothetical protein